MRLFPFPFQPELFDKDAYNTHCEIEICPRWSYLWCWGAVTRSLTSFPYESGCFIASVGNINPSALATEGDTWAFFFLRDCLQPRLAGSKPRAASRGTLKAANNTNINNNKNPYPIAQSGGSFGVCENAILCRRCPATRRPSEGSRWMATGTALLRLYMCTLPSDTWEGRVGVADAGERSQNPTFRPPFGGTSPSVAGTSWQPSCVALICNGALLTCEVYPCPCSFHMIMPVQMESPTKPTEGPEDDCQTDQSILNRAAIKKRWKK